MPILEFHLTAGRHTDEQVTDLLLAAARCYAEVLRSPPDRVRVVAHTHRPQHLVVGGRLLSEGGEPAPWFHFLVLEGRPVEECQALIRSFTDLLVQTLGVERSRVRGGCWAVPPTHWGIGGEPASVLRAQEIAARAAAAAEGGASRA